MDTGYTPLHVFQKVQFSRKRAHSFYEILKGFLCQKVEAQM